MYQTVDETDFFLIEEFQLINSKGIIELHCHHFVTPNQTTDLSYDHQWLLNKGKATEELYNSSLINFRQPDTVHFLM